MKSRRMILCAVILAFALTVSGCHGTGMPSDAVPAEGTESTALPGSVTDAGTVPETEPETEPVTEPETKSETEPVTEPVTEPETEPETEPAAEPETVPETVPETEPETKPETEPETEPATEPSEPVIPISPASDAAGKGVSGIPAVTESNAKHGMRRFVLLTDDNPGLPFSAACKITDTEITAVLPAGVDLTALVPTFEGADLRVNGQKLRSGADFLDFTFPIKATVVKNGNEYPVTLRIQTLYTGLPSVAVTVDGFKTIVSKDEYLPGTFWFGGGDPTVCSYAAGEPVTVEASFKGRGNTSWGFEKKGYTVKLSEKTDVLGLGKSKNYTLISNYQDKSLMRNEIAAYLSEQLGLVTMKTRSVDLWLNGSYHGTYMVIEKVEIEKGRIDIPEKDSLAPDELGYLMEWDGHVSEVSEAQKFRWQKVGDTIYDPTADTYFMTSPGYLVIHKPNPEKMTREHINYITSLVNEADRAISSHNAEEIGKRLDLTSFAAWYLVEDIMKNMDACFWSSCYMYADGEGVLHMGPVWDFDMSLGNANYGNCDNPSGSYIEGCRWYHDLLRVPEFCEEIDRLLKENKDFFDAVPGYMDGYARMLETSQKYNFERWKILERGVGANPMNVINEHTYKGQVAIAKNFYVQRLSYVRSSVAGYVRKAEQQSQAEEEMKNALPSGGQPIWTGFESVTSGRSLNISKQFSPLDLSEYRGDGIVCLTYRVEKSSIITRDCQLELTSSGTCDREEISWSLSGEVILDGGWRRVYFPVSQCGKTGGEIGWNRVNYFRIYLHVNGEDTLEIADVRIYHEDELQ